MSSRRLSWVLLLLLAPVRVSAQDRLRGEPILPEQGGKASHMLLGDEVSSQGLEQALAERLRLSRELHAAQKVIEDLLRSPGGQEDLRRLQEQLQRDPVFRRSLEQKLLDNPAWRDQVAEAIRDRQLQGGEAPEWVKQLRSGPPQPSPPDPVVGPMPPGTPEPPPGTPEPPPGTPDRRPPAPPPDAQAQAPPAAPPPPPEPRQPSWLRQQMSKQLGRLADRLEREGADSEAIRSLVSALGQPGDFSWRLPVSGADLQGTPLAGLWNAIPPASDWLPLEEIGSALPSLDFGGLDLKGFDMPDLPGLPSVGDGLSDLALSAAGGPAESGGLIPILLYVLMFGMVLVVVWKMFGMLGDDGRQGRHEGWALGGWPVAPGRVTTRADLIRAFEYLACFLLGKEAIHCHHLELAARLHEKDPGHAEAADRLARLYEQARYAPAQEVLSASEQAEARHDLALLAGGAAG